MSRPWRIQFPGAVYHVSSRGNNRQAIFRSDPDREKFLSLLEQASSRFHLHIFVFCLMSNHYHLFLRTPDANLSAAMHWLNTTYTIHFNRNNRHSGHLFQGRYKSVLVQDESHWLHLSIYIHLNPVRAGMVNDPAHYAWTSFRDYTRTKSRFPWLHAEEILSNYGAEGAEARRNYKKACIAFSGKPSSFWQSIRSDAVLGSKEAIDKLMEKYHPKGKAKDVSGFRSAPCPKDFEKELCRVASAFDVKPEELKKRRRNFLPRQVAYYHLVENCEFPVTKVSDIMGITQPAVSFGIAKMKQNLKKDKNLRKAMEGLYEK